jgi:GNAT superfamily N-acetyltransferase
VGLLSNILAFRDGHWGPDRPAQVRLATGDEIEPALRLILSPPGGTADAKGIQEFIAFAGERGMGFSALHVAERGGRLVSAVLPVISPGRTMLMMLPVGLGKAAEGATGQLIEAVCRYGAERDVHLAQVLVDPQDGASERMLADQGFDRMAELYYLQQHVPTAAAELSPCPALPEGMRWETYSAQTHGAFGRAILESYRDSLDCPSLNGLREIDDIIAGHQASGVFVPESWFLLREGETALGVLLLCESSRSESVELVYLGLSPAARGRGLSELMMRHAAAVVARRGMSRLYLAVDSRNVPALKLYYRHGMQRVSSKVAMLKDLRGS